MAIMRTVGDFWAAHPTVDYAAPALAALAWWQWGAGLTPSEIEVRVAIHAGVAVLSGLVLTSATFVCALTYQSANILMTGMRQRYSRELKRNWFAIIMGAFWMAVLPLFALALDGTARTTALGISAAALALLCMRATRCAMWLRISLFMQEASERVPRTVEVPTARQSQPTTVG